MSLGERWFLILVELLTITQWVEVRGDFCWYWWNCWPSLNEFRGERWLKWGDIGGIVDHHSMILLKWEIEGDFCWYWWNCWPSLKVRGDFCWYCWITQWVMVRGDFCWYWWNCWPSLNELVIERWFWWFLLILVELLTITQWIWGERWWYWLLTMWWYWWNCWGDYGSYWWNCWPSLNELRWEVIDIELLTITQWVEVRGDFCWYWWNCWPSLNELKVRGDFCWYWWNCWPSLNELIFVVLVERVEKWLLLILVELLTITQWVEVRGDFCWYWWIVDHHSMSCGERWFLLILVELLTITQWVDHHSMSWEVIFVDIGGGIVDHHSMSCGERWLLLILVELLTITQWVMVRGVFLLILVELLTITQWVEVRGDFCWYWLNCWPSFNELKWEVILVDIGGIVDHHSMSLGERWFLLILVELLTITQWVEVRGDFCWYWWNCWPSLNELWWEVIVVDIGGIVDNHSMSYGERWFLLILVGLLTIVDHWSERWFLLILVELLTITQWVEVRGDFWGDLWLYWWNCWPSLNELRWEVIVVDIGGIVDHHSMSWSERWFLLILVELLTITQWVEGERWFLLILVELLTITQCD